MFQKKELFSEDSGQDLVKYLERFEEYCSDSFKGRKYLWIGELERQLKGKTLHGFKAIRDFDDSYEEMKAKFMKWYAADRELRKNKAKLKFKNAKPKSGETLFLYSTRLEGLYKKGYSSQKVDTSKTLMDQFKRTAQKQSKTEI